ncbi:NLP/P60 family protein [Lachnospiraceae bacterium KM106-2]|nr:NLP/P60 family protein [Lachnospiraceae bacterium KM106-2]
MAKWKLIRTTICFAIPLVAMSSTNVKASTIENNNTSMISIIQQETYSEIGSAIDDYLNGIPTNVMNEEDTYKYKDLAISTADTYVNIRKSADDNSEILGKLYTGGAATILEDQGEWVKVTSGNVTGYIHSDYLAIGRDAEALFDKYATKIATITTQTLKVREKKELDSSCLTLVAEGTPYTVLGENEDWVKIQTDAGKGYVSKEYVTISYDFDYAVSIEEEQERIRQEQEAEQTSNQETTSSNRTSTSARSNKTSSRKQTTKRTTSTVKTASSVSGSTTGARLVSYAKQFVGNPYVWGGTSLTNGTDCSGFTQAVFRQFGYSIPRTSRLQASVGRAVSTSDLQAGDLLFYAKGGTINHVAIYIGGGKIVHASNPKTGITISNYNYRSVYKAKRVLR